MTLFGFAQMQMNFVSWGYPTFHLGPFDVTVSTCQHMLLYRHPAMIGSLLIHVKKDYPGYHFFASALVSRCPDLATLYCFGTDGEAAEGVCKWCSW